LLSVINDILDFSKFDAGQLTVERTPFDPVAAIAAVVALLEPRLTAGMDDYLSKPISLETLGAALGRSEVSAHSWPAASPPSSV